VTAGSGVLELDGVSKVYPGSPPVRATEYRLQVVSVFDSAYSAFLGSGERNDGADDDPRRAADHERLPDVNADALEEPHASGQEGDQTDDPEGHGIDVRVWSVYTSR